MDRNTLPPLPPIEGLSNALPQVDPAMQNVPPTVTAQAMPAVSDVSAPGMLVSVPAKVSGSRLSNLAIPLLVVTIVLLSSMIAGVVFLTPQGRKLVGIDYSVASSQPTTSVTTSVSVTSAAPSLDLSGDNAESAAEKVSDEIDKDLEGIQPNEDFADFDAEVEFGL